MKQEMNLSTVSSTSSAESTDNQRPSQVLRWTINIGLVALILVVVVGGITLAIDTVAKSGLAVGAKAPVITGTDLDGNTIDSRNLAGQPIMLVFWSPDCHACADAYPTLQAIDDDPTSAVALITVAGDTTLAETEAKVSAANLTFPTIVDESQDLLDLFKVPGYPHTYLINPDGTIDQVIEGIGAPDELDLAVSEWTATCARGASCSVEEVQN